MNFESALKYLGRFTSYEKNRDFVYGENTFNLKRVSDFAKGFDVDYSNIDFVHVAGSKGKGSVCSMLAKYLWTKNEKVGLYTSPHIFDVRERFQINGERISERLFGAYVENLKNFIEENGDFGLTYFEILTVIALKWFSDENVRYAIMEVGLGGRLDATNIIFPKVCVLTRVEKEHTDILGEEIEQIIDEKLGILKEGVPLVVGGQSEEVERILRHKLSGRGGFYFVEEEEYINAMTVFEVLKILCGSVDKKVFDEVLRNFHFDGRLDVREIEGKLVVFDIAHTPASMELLAGFLRTNFRNKKFIFLISVLKDKQGFEIFKILSGVAEKIVFTTLPVLERSMGKTEFERFKVPFSGDISFKADCRNAFVENLNELKKDQVLVVTGSHFLVGEIMRFLSLF